jgi:hypothetical protein
MNEFETESTPYKLIILSEELDGNSITVKVTEATKDAIFKGCEANAEKGVFIDFDGDSFFINFTKLIFIGSEKVKEKPKKANIATRILDNLVKDALNDTNDFDEEDKY